MEQEPQLPIEPIQEPENGQRYKTLGIRLDEETHARLSFIAQLTGSTLTDEIKTAIGARITTAQSDPELIERAQQVREQIEREARARQAAIAGLFGAVALSTEVEAKTPIRRSRGGGADTN